MTHDPFRALLAQLQKLVATFALVLCFSPLPAQLQGTFTIGGNAPDYATINAAVADLITEGIAGAVVFNVAEGTYDEQVEIGKISGTSATNTITFQPMPGVVGKVTVTSQGKYVIRLNNASHIRLLELEITATSFDGRALEVINQADDLLIEGNQLWAEVAAPDPDHAVLYLKPSLASNIRIRGNRITGASYGIYFSGSASSPPTGTEITGNLVEDFFYTGVYLQSLQGGSFTGNRIRGTVTFYYGDCGLCVNSWKGTPAAPVLVANNFISVTTKSLAVGLSNADYLQFYHNTVNASGNNVPAFDLTFAKNVAVKNNIFQASKEKAVVVYGAVSLDMDYNDLFTEGTYLGRWENSTVTDLEEWQSTSGQGAHSISIDPQFTSALAGAGVAVSEVTADFYGELRGTPPSIGAVEYVTDNDGIDNDEDNCPTTYNPGQEDFDGDGIGDVCDTDDDNDGVADTGDCDPYDSSVSVPTTFYADADADGFGDPNDAQEACFQPIGYVRNSLDCDDNDPLSYPGQSWYVDRDGDGHPEDVVAACARPADAFLETELTSIETDNCPGIANPDQSDTDGDGVGDACQPGSGTLSGYWLEAECGVVGSNWEVVADSDASNHAFVYAPGQRFTVRPPADVPDNRIRFTVERAEAGSYFLHLRAFTRNSGKDSFWIRANGGHWIRWNNIDCDRKFSWATLPTLLELSAGSNTVDIAFREGGTIIDKLFLARDPTQPTGFGEPSTNCSILAPQPPTAIATASVTQGAAPLTVHLDGSESYDYDGQIVQYAWTWQGGSATGPTPTVIFAAGVYTVKLKVTDNTGNTNTTSLALKVTLPSGIPSSPPFSFEAECTVRDRNWRLSESTEASGNRFVSYTGCRCEGEPTMRQADQHLNYDFVSPQEDTFYLFFRLEAPDVGRNSFWVRVDGGNWIKMWRESNGGPLLTSGFEWRRVNDDADPVFFYLGPGKHTVTVAPREPGTKLDKILLSTTDALPLGTGAAAQNCLLSSTYSLSKASGEEVFPYEDAMFTAARFSVFPNPVTDIVTVELSDGYTGEVAFAVVDALGRQVRHLRRYKEDRTLRSELSVEDLPHGIYYLQLLQGQCQTIERFVKQ